MTDTEKKIMVRLCTKLLQYVDFSDDKEAEALINWVLTQRAIKKNNNKIRSLIGEYRHAESDRRKSVKEALERGGEICQERDKLYGEQQELKHKLWRVEQDISK